MTLTIDQLPTIDITAALVEWGQVAQCTLEAHSFNVRPAAVLLIPKHTVTSPVVCIVRPDPIL